MTDTAALNRHHAIAIAETAIHMGVSHAVLSPGARNTPIVLALHDMQEAGWPIELISVLDERAAAFYALGIARRTDRPVLLSCTSGSAGAHYYPAIVEASEGQVPLLVITADRPEELQGRGAPQTMTQQNLYGPHVRFFSNLGSPKGPADSVREVVRQGIQAALGPAPGPVHLNAPFRKPLWEAGGETPAPHTPEPISRAPVVATNADIARLHSETHGSKGIIVVGPDSSARISTASVCKLAQLLGWPILADPASQIRYGSNGPVIHHHDVLLRSSKFRQEFRPSVALTLGGTTSSKELSTLLANTRCIHLSGSGRHQDPWQSVAWTLEADLDSIVEELRQTEQPPTSDWQQGWLNANQIAADAIKRACMGTLWEGSVAHAMVAALPDNTLLRLASSMPIRDVDSFSTNTSVPLTVSSNRGVNGIDGLIATSLGEARVHPGPVAVLSGDLSFLHDIGALTTVPRPTTPVVFVIPDNGGGGIFGHLPMAKHPTGFEPWFVTPHGQNIPQICRGFGIDVDEVDTIEAFKTALTTRTSQPGLHVIHLPIDRASSTQEHVDCFRELVNLIEEQL